MKRLLGLLIACFSLAVVCARVTPKLNPYPVVFTAVYNASDIAEGVPAQMTTFYMDLPNKRARATLPNPLGDYILIFRPPGADPSSWYSHNYTQLILHPPYPYNTTKCVYQGIDDQGPWPANWMHSAGSEYIEEVGPFFELPDNMQYSGTYFVDELGINTDRWDSIDMCKLVRSGIGNVPCVSVMFTQGANPVPAMDIQARSGISSGRDSYFVRVYHTFKTSVSGSDFALPQQWQRQCANGNAGFNLSPTVPFTMYSDGTSEAKAIISLLMPPVQSLGSVTVSVKVFPTAEEPCDDCVSADVTSLTFTAANWNVPQVVPMTYRKRGCSNVQVNATGGGFDWTPASSWVIRTCKGSASKGCELPPQCY